MNLSGLCHRQGANVRFTHIAEVIAEALQLDMRDWQRERLSI
jgi:hypothetical protein